MGRVYDPVFVSAFSQHVSCKSETEALEKLFKNVEHNHK